MSTKFVILALLIFVVVTVAREIFDESKVIRAQRVQRLRNQYVNKEGGRIIGGNEAELGEFPYHVSLRDDIGRFCGGAIISNRWVMTAQHCVDSFDIYIDWLNIVTGAHHSTIGGYDYPVDRIVNHPEFNWATLTNDISLLRTDREIVFGDLVTAIPFSNAHVGAGITTRTSSWGSTVLEGESSEYLQYLNLISLTNLDCETRVSDGYPVSDDMLCAFSMERGRGLCHGDSGSPMTANGVVIGIASWVITCGLGRPDGFVRVSHFYEWIVSTMANESFIALQSSYQ